jgi:tetratricopeptide (TPR) repeat protein
VIRSTLAEEVLRIEEVVWPTAPGMRQLLAELTADVRERLAGAARADGERERALRALGTIEEVLTAHGFVYPGIGYVGFLHDGLQPITVDDAGRAALLARRENHARLDMIRTATTFHIADCDIFSLLYASIGEELGLPIAMVDVPPGREWPMAHDYVVWTLGDGSVIRWEADEGQQREVEMDEAQFDTGKPDLDYAHAVAKRAYVVPLTRDEVLGYAHWMMGLEWNDRGAYPTALAEYEIAMRMWPASPKAPNSIAWLLATAPDPTVRDGTRSVALATRATELWANASHLDTLAAAYASLGRWEDAVATERRAIDVGPSHDSEPDFRDRLERLQKCNPIIEPRASEVVAQRWRGDLRDPAWGPIVTSARATPTAVVNHCITP